MKRSRKQQYLRQRADEAETDFSVTDRQKRKNKKKFKTEARRLERREGKSDVLSKDW